MYRFHPQWQKALSLVRNRWIGELRTIQSFFSYYNDDPGDIRNIADMGGGGIMDIGCYCISLARFLFEREPAHVCGNMKFDDNFNTDYLASGILDFGSGTATFTCSTQTAADQRVHIIGTEGHITIEIPFNAPPDRETKMILNRDGEVETLGFGPVDQYTLQAEAFSDAVVNDTDVPTPLNDAVNNMVVIEAMRKSADTGKKIEISST